MNVLDADFDDRIALEDIDSREQKVGNRAQRVEIGANIGRVRQWRIDSGAMYWGVPSTVLAPVNWTSRPSSNCLTRPKSSSLTTSRSPPWAQSMMLAGLMSRWIRPMSWASVSAPQTIPRIRSTRVCRLRTGDRDDFLQVRAVEQLHCVVQDAVVGSTVVEDGDCIGVGQTCGELHFALEAKEVELACANHPAAV